MLQKGCTKAFSETYHVGDHVTVGAVREALGDLPDDADIVVAAREHGGSFLPVRAIEVGRAETTLHHPWREFAHLVVLLDDTGTGASPQRKTPPTPAARWADSPRSRACRRLALAGESLHA